MSPAEAVGSVRLRVPAAWIELDLDPTTRAESTILVVEERAGGDRAMLREMLEVAAADAAQQGAVYAAIFSDSVGGRAVSASLVVSVMDPETALASVNDPAEAWDARLALAQGVVAEFHDDGADAHVRTLDAGPAARVRSRQRVEGGAEHPTGEVDLLQYFVPFPQGDRLAVLTFSTPNLGLADAFVEVFDAIAGTLQWPS